MVYFKNGIQLHYVTIFWIIILFYQAISINLLVNTGCYYLNKDREYRLLSLLSNHVYKLFNLNQGVYQYHTMLNGYFYTFRSSTGYSSIA